MKKFIIVFTVVVLSALNSTGQQDTLKTTDKTDTAALDILYLVEKQAEFPGGLEALMQYLNKNISYPPKAVEEGFTGMVIIEFIVEKDGSISNVKVKNRVHPLLDSAAVAVISNMPAWIPGEQKGKQVRSIFVIPIQFTMGKKEKSGKADRVLRRYDRRNRKHTQ